MNLIFSFLNSMLIAIVFVSVLGPHQVNAAICTEKTGFTCVASDHTESTCDKTSRLCDCVKGYLPIPTGCAENKTPPNTATVSFGTRIGQRVSSADDIKLTCAHNVPGTVTYEWKKGTSTVTGQTDQTYVVTGDDIVGKYSCTVKDSTSTSHLAVSDPQEIVKFEATKVIPVVKLNTDTAAPGVPLDVQCTGIPFGADYTFKLYPSNTTVAKGKVKQDPQDKTITCVLNDTKSGEKWGKPESDPVKLPTEAKDITKVTISPITDVIVKADSSVVFTCGTEPAATFMETAKDKIVFTFKDSGNNSPNNQGSTYILTPSTGDKTNRTVSCSAKYGDNVEHNSGQVVVIFSDNDIDSTLLASSTTVHPGDRLLLTCVTDPEAQITWSKNKEPITGETERIIQIGNFQPSDAGNYTCSVTKNAVVQLSNEVVISTSSAPGLPALGSAVTVLVAVLSWRLF